jgi:hypothetical protein
MPRFGAYDVVLSEKAASFVISQPKRKQTKIMDLAFQLADYQFQVGDYSSTDDSGRELHHIDLGHCCSRFGLTTQYVKCGSQKSKLSDLANPESCVARSRHTTLVEQAPGKPETTGSKGN